jgi:hypothetical protein
VTGETGTSPGAGKTSELLGLGCGVITSGGGGICANAPHSAASSVASAMTQAAFACMVQSFRIFLKCRGLAKVPEARGA